MVPEIYFTKLIFEMEALESFQVPGYLGSTLHGAFGWRRF